MLRKIIFLLLFPSAAFGVSQVWNSCTGCPDYLGSGGGGGITPGASYYAQINPASQQAGGINVATGTFNGVTSSTITVSSVTVQNITINGTCTGAGCGTGGGGMTAGASYYANINPPSPQSGGINLATGTFSGVVTSTITSTSATLSSVAANYLSVNNAIGGSSHTQDWTTTGAGTVGYMDASGNMIANELCATASCTSGMNSSMMQTPFIYSTVEGDPSFVLNSAGTYYGFVENRDAHTWDLGYGTNYNALGTAVIKWNDSNQVAIPYGLSIGSMTGAGLSSCSGGSNALTWNSGTNLFGCNTISGGSGGASTLAVTTGTSSGYTTNISSPTGVIIANGAEFLISQQGSATAYWLLNPSSVTMYGPNIPTTAISNGTLGALVISSITLLGDVTGTGNNPLTTTAKATQTNITSISPSATLSLGNANYAVNYSSNTIMPGTTFYQNGYAVIGSSLNVGYLTGAGLSTCGSTSQAQSYSATTGQFGCTTITAAGLGAITGNQNITLSGDSTGGPAATAITVTAAANQANIKTLSASSVTVTGNLEVDGWTTHKGSVSVTGAGGLGVTYGITATTATLNGVPYTFPSGVGAGGLFTVNTSSTVSISNTLAAAQFPALTGDITTSAGALATTAAASQANIKTFTSSITITGTGGLSVTQGISASSASFYTTTATTPLVVMSTNNATAFSVANSSVTAGDYMLYVSSFTGSTSSQYLATVDTYGNLLLYAQKLATLKTTTPATTGQIVYCSDCTATLICVSTGTANAYSYSSAVSKITACN